MPNPEFETILCKKININTFFAYQFMDEETTDGLLQGKCYGKFFEKGNVMESNGQVCVGHMSMS